MNTDNLKAFYYDYLEGNSYFKGLIKSRFLIEDTIKDIEDLKKILNDATGEIITKIILKIDDLIGKLNDNKFKLYKVIGCLYENARYFDNVYNKFQKKIGKAEEIVEPSQFVNYSFGDKGGGYYATKNITEITNVDVMNNNFNYLRITKTIRTEKYFKPLLPGPPLSVGFVCSPDNLYYTEKRTAYETYVFHKEYYL